MQSADTENLENIIHQLKNYMDDLSTGMNRILNELQVTNEELFYHELCASLLDRCTLALKCYDYREVMIIYSSMMYLHALLIECKQMRLDIAQGRS